MPVIHSSYRPAWWLRHGHVQTCWPVLFRDMPPLPCVRRRMTLPDGDFLDVDVHRRQGSERSRRAVIISHGLEGNSRRKYVIGMARVCLEAGFDVLAWNMRSCSGQMNDTDRLYHMGQTGDVAAVADWALRQGYGELALMGFSMGGNQILKWLGENPDAVPTAVKLAFVVSVPCDLPSAAPRLDSLACRPYMEYFMRTMRRKVREKAARFPGYPSVAGMERCHTFREFDSRFTAPLYGFASADEYWAASSAAPLLRNIRIPVCLLQAQDDPFCTPACFPVEAAERNPRFTLEIARHGGHVGFVVPGTGARYWSELRAAAFLRERWPWRRG